MTRYNILFFVLFISKIYAQKECGFYNISGFETASGIYLLENKTFFYYASFGNVDLKIFGNYKIRNDSVLTFQPDKELMQDFYIYGTATKVQNDSIIINYQKPFKEKFKDLTINKISFPEFNSDKNTVSVSIKKPNCKLLKLGYTNPNEKKEHFLFQLTNNINELLIFDNYYAEMARRFALGSFKIGEGVLIDNGREVNKKEINEKVMNEAIGFIESRRNKNTLTRNGKTYQKLAATANTVHKQ